MEGNCHSIGVLSITHFAAGCKLHGGLIRAPASNDIIGRFGSIGHELEHGTPYRCGSASGIGIAQGSG